MVTKFINKYNKIVGELEGRTFTKNVRRSVHFMRTLKSWGMDKSAFDRLKNRCDVIKIIDSESKISLITTYDIFNSFGVLKDYGYGEQIFLKEKYFRRSSDKQAILI